MEVRKNILKLATKISIGSLTYQGPIKVTDPEYRLLAPVVTDEMCDVAMIMPTRKYMTLEEVAKKCKKSVEKTDELLHQMEYVGICRAHVENGVEMWFQPIWLPGIIEMMVNNTEQVKKYPDIGVCFEEFTRRRTAPLVAMFPVGSGLTRVLPVESAIQSDTQVLSSDEVSHFVETAWRLSVADCSCRRSRRILGEGCGHIEKDICIQVNEGAEFYIRTGRGREITKEEAYEILKRAEDNGLVHEITNIEGEGKSLALCNCCGCSCFSLRLANMYRTPDFVRTNYVAKVEKEKCVACGMCVENCNVGALKLGQKLCTTEPIPQEETVTSRDRIWGKKYWNVDYRTNRETVVPTGTAPCKSACPAHLAVQGYVKLAAQGKYREALELIKEENPFPAVCGRVCNRLCEDACTRGAVDNPIAIDEIKKYIAEQELDPQTRYVPKLLNMTGEKYGIRIAVIGGGPAGLSCAYYLQRRGYDVTVFDKNERMGGMMTFGIPTFRLEKSVVEAEIDVLREMGVEFRCSVEVGKDVTIPELREQGFKAFYLAIGAQGARMPGIRGEDAKGVISAIDFMHEVNLNEANRLEGRTVVIGGGNVATDVARAAVRAGSTSVGIYCLEKRELMPASASEVEESLAEGIAIQNEWGPAEILTKKGRVTGIVFRKCMSTLDEKGRFAPKFDENDTVTVDCDNVVLAIGQSVVWGDLLSGLNLELNPNQTVKADPETYQTSEPDIFVGGDVYTGPKWTIDAIAAGKEASISIHRFSHPGQDMMIGRDRRRFRQLDKATALIPLSYDNSPRQIPDAAPADEAKQTFRDLRATFTEEQLKKETDRCLGCGATVVDEYMCVGCGICTTKCKFDAIHLERRYNAPGEIFEKKALNIAPYEVKRVGKIAVRTVKEVGTKVVSALSKE